MFKGKKICSRTILKSNKGQNGRSHTRLEWKKTDFKIGWLTISGTKDSWNLPALQSTSALGKDLELDLGFENPQRSIVLCFVLKWSASKVFLIFQHGYACRQMDISNSTFIIFAYAWFPFHKHVWKSAVISNTFLPQSNIFCVFFEKENVDDGCFHCFYLFIFENGFGCAVAYF